MAELRHPNPIRVRLKWDTGRMQTLDGTVDGLKLELFVDDESGETHRFEESGSIDADGYHVFVQNDDAPEDDGPASE